MTNHTIRAAAAGDATGIDEVHRGAFDTDLEARLVALLIERGKATISLVAEAQGIVAGHILFSPASIVPAHVGPASPAGTKASADAMRSGLGLAPVAVLPAFQKQGFGTALIRAGLAECSRLAIPWVIVLGHETYYPRFGFAPASRWNLTGDYGSSDAFQFLPLTAAADEIRGGHIHYAQEFGELLG